MSQYSLRLPTDLYEKSARLAKEQGVSLNQLFLYAISNTVGKLEAEEFFKFRSSGISEEAAKKGALDVLRKVKSRPIYHENDALT